MRIINRKLLLPGFALFCLMFLGGCATTLSTVSQYDETAYQNAVTLKREALALMSSATNPYPEDSQRLRDVSDKIGDAYRYLQAKPQEDISEKQWLILKGDFDRFLFRWKENGTLSSTFINEYKSVISDEFDEIACLEESKKNPQMNCKDVRQIPPDIIIKHPPVIIKENPVIKNTVIKENTPQNEKILPSIQKNMQ